MPQSCSNSPQTIPGHLVQRSTDVLLPNAGHPSSSSFSSSSEPHQLALIAEYMYCSLTVSCVQISNPQMEVGAGADTGQASALLCTPVFPFPSLKEGAPPPNVHPWGPGLQGSYVIDDGLPSHPRPLPPGPLPGNPLPPSLSTRWEPWASTPSPNTGANILNHRVLLKIRCFCQRATFHFLQTLIPMQPTEEKTYLQ